NVGDTVNYLITIDNISSGDSPDLTVDSLFDDLFGDLSGDAPPACDSLAPGASCSFSLSRVALITDQNPLVNTVTVHYHPDGFTNDITDSDSHSVTINTPASVDLMKMAVPNLIEPGDTVTFTIDATNNGQANLLGCLIVDDNGTPADVSDDITFGPFNLVPAQSVPFVYTDDVSSDRKNTAQIVCLDPDNNPKVDMAMAMVTVLFVGGNYMPIDSIALLLAGIQNSAAWIVPIIAGSAGVGLYLVKSRISKN
ncbi:MAG: hypothetical protein ACRD94_05305, partial [Nitrosopumilaceae archaeon]